MKNIMKNIVERVIFLAVGFLLVINLYCLADSNLRTIDSVSYENDKFAESMIRFTMTCTGVENLMGDDDVCNKYLEYLQNRDN